jgi:hypothetical protein
VDTFLLALARTVLKIGGRPFCSGLLAVRSVSGSHNRRVVAFWAEDRLFLEDLSEHSAQLIKRKCWAAECHVHRNLLTHVSGPFRSNLDRDSVQEVSNGKFSSHFYDVESLSLLIDNLPFAKLFLGGKASLLSLGKVEPILLTD